MNARYNFPCAGSQDIARMVAALRHPACYSHVVQDVTLLETHISWVILAGAYAYKIKKPVNLGFLDFSSLAARRHYCEEELRLNRRLAPDLYIAVVPSTGDMDAPRIEGGGAVLEYAVKMRRLRVPFVIISICAASDVLRARIASRAASSGDASEATLAVLNAQIAAIETLSSDEWGDAIAVNAGGDVTAATRELSNALQQRLR